MANFNNLPSQVTSSYWDPENFANWGIPRKSSKPQPVKQVEQPQQSPASSKLAPVTQINTSLPSSPSVHLPSAGSTKDSNSKNHISPNSSTIAAPVITAPASTASTMTASNTTTRPAATPLTTTIRPATIAHPTTITHPATATRPAFGTKDKNLHFHSKAAALRSWLDDDNAKPKPRRADPQRLTFENSGDKYEASKPTQSTITAKKYTPPAVRPTKTIEVVRRMIFHDLGFKVPKKTPEQRAKDMAIREQERLRLSMQREERKKYEQERVDKKLNEIL